MDQRIRQQESQERWQKEERYRRTLNIKTTRIFYIQVFFVILSSCFFLSCSLLWLRVDSTRIDGGSKQLRRFFKVRTSWSTQVHEPNSLFQSMKKAEVPQAISADHPHSTKHNNNVRFGAVMSEFACRVLSRHVTSSNVLVVAHSAVSLAKEAVASLNPKKTNYAYVETQQESVGAAFLRFGIAEGHSIHAMNDHGTAKQRAEKMSPSLDDWWSSFGNDIMSYHVPTNATGSEPWFSTNPNEKPSWVLLAVFDSLFGAEDTVWQNADLFLEGCTVTYIVIAVHSVKLKNGSYRFGGLNAIESLLRRRYKVQNLSCSHFHATHDNGSKTFQLYGPNALFQSMAQVKDFLRWGADASQMYGESTDDIFTSYIFATQGLDLAIPTPLTYLEYGDTEIDVFSKHDMSHLPPLKLCPKANNKNTNLDFDFDENYLRLHLSDQKSIKYSRDEIGQKLSEDVSIWMNGKGLSDSEAVCMNHTNGVAKCKTRIANIDISKSIVSRNSQSPNILLLLLDPISRSHFDRVMTQTNEVVTELNFTRFERYTAVGPNSGPNQAALYSGIKLEKRGDLHNDLGDDKWLWDRLRAAGYVTLKAEDSCIENSNMMQSLAPNTTHGSALQGLFCFDAFSRPNCIGPDLASSILFDYGEQFVSTYEKLRKATRPNLRWASFMHFVDSHEDTMILPATLDSGLSKFLKSMAEKGHFENSVVILTSDHGLHYGPNFPTREGRREATEPILYLHIPPYLRKLMNVDALNSNSHLWTTPFDLHETLLELTQTSLKGSRDRRRGLTLTNHLPESRNECRNNSELIPTKYCDLQLSETTEDNDDGICEVMKKMPTTDSFFLDMPPLKRRPLMNLDSECHDAKQTSSDVSICSEYDRSL